MAFEPIDDDATEEGLDQVMAEGEPAEAQQLPPGHLMRQVNGNEVLVKIPTPHQVVAFERARAALHDRARRIQATKGLETEDIYRMLMPVLVDLDTKTLAFAESMMPDADQRSMVDEWLIQGTITPSELVMALQGRTVPPEDDEDAVAPEPAKRPNPLKRAPKKAANAKRTKR